MSVLQRNGKIGYTYNPITNGYTITETYNPNIIDNWVSGIRGGKVPPVSVTVSGYHLVPNINKVIFNPPATIVFWQDDTKTVVKCMEGREFDKWEGLSMAICKKLFGKKFKHTFKKWCEND